MSIQSENYMLRCLELARSGAGTVAPNPMVGCVIVHEDKIIGEGYTSPYGGSHAEVNAIRSVKKRSLLKKATLYVSLEPCAHYGKTPPCVDLIIEKKIKQVVMACLDPFSKVNGRGIKRLLEAHVDVTVGVLEAEAKELNRRFFTFHQKKRPYVILKWAETANGFVDRERTDKTEPSLKITSEPANILVHKWRAEEAAIMVGKNTALLDNPSLTTRRYEGKNPVRIVLDGKLEVPGNANIFSDAADTLLFTQSGSQTGDQKSCATDSTTETISVENIHELHPILSELYKRNIQSVIVEGGPTLHASFYHAGLWDEIRRFVSSQKIDDGIKALQVSALPEEETQLGGDQLLIYRNR